MASEAPPFWWQKADWRAALLWPAALLWGPVAARRLRAGRKIAFELPVISVATLAIGATGRTLVAAAIARAAQRGGKRPGLLSAGPQGTSSTPHRVDAHHDLVRHVGGEAIELARVATTVICADIAAGARALAAEGCDVIVIADGRMADRLETDRLVVVADARRGLGNGFVVPAGPVRAPLTALLTRADVIVRLGEGDAADGIVRRAARAARPVVEARIVMPQDLPQRAMAFAAVGDNEGFFAALRRAGVDLAECRGFPDGHSYAEDELADLEDAATDLGLPVLTTRRDLERVKQAGLAGKAFARRAMAVEPELACDPVQALDALVRDAVMDWRNRRAV
jgi:tetraacyldisaccharide 4'-kinase